MSEPSRLFEVFMDIQRGLPRQGPGCAEATRRALALCQPLPPQPRVLDVGCGPGMQSMALAEALKGRVIAADTALEYLTQLRDGSAARGLAGRIHPLAADMMALPFAAGSFDLIWAEGSAYIMGFAEALSAWRLLLAPGGHIAVTELTWLRSDPPAEAAAFFAEEYPAMSDVRTNLAALEGAGYQALGHFVLPEAAWWDDYYGPLEAKLPTLRARYAADREALALVEQSAQEIEMRRRYPEAYGYVFFVGRKAAGED